MLSIHLLCTPVSDLFTDEAQLKNINSYAVTPDCGDQATGKAKCWSLDIPFDPETPKEHIDNLNRELYGEEEEQ